MKHLNSGWYAKSYKDVLKEIILIESNLPYTVLTEYGSDCEYIKEYRLKIQYIKGDIVLFSIKESSFKIALPRQYYEQSVKTSTINFEELQNNIRSKFLVQ